MSQGLGKDILTWNSATRFAAFVPGTGGFWGVGLRKMVLFGDKTMS
jgi:hypothetical protein